MPVHSLSNFTARLIAFGLAAAFALPATAQAPKKDEFQTSAPYAILIDAESGTVLFEKNADKLNPPASMSKLMTTEVVLHAIAQGKLKYEDEMTVSENAWRKGGAPSGGSAMFARAQQPGERARPAARRDDPVRQRCLHRARRRHRRQRAGVRRA